jgi:uncharacterized membrane protein (UPF0182 family)
MGAVVTPAAQADEGEPIWWLRNLEPAVERDRRAPEDLELTEPSVFFGQLMRDYVILVPGRDGALTGTPGRDFPYGIPWTPSCARRPSPGASRT